MKIKINFDGNEQNSLYFNNVKILKKGKYHITFMSEKGDEFSIPNRYCEIVDYKPILVKANLSNAKFDKEEALKEAIKKEINELECGMNKNLKKNFLNTMMEELTKDKKINKIIIISIVFKVDEEIENVRYEFTEEEFSKICVWEYIENANIINICNKLYIARENLISIEIIK